MEAGGARREATASYLLERSSAWAGQYNRHTRCAVAFSEVSRLLWKGWLQAGLLTFLETLLPSPRGWGLRGCCWTACFSWELRFEVGNAFFHGNEALSSGFARLPTWVVIILLIVRKVVGFFFALLPLPTVCCLNLVDVVCHFMVLSKTSVFIWLWVSCWNKVL